MQGKDSSGTDIKVSNGVVPSEPAVSAEDAASSLRAAALLTLKFNKRRKPGDQAAQSSALARPMIVDTSVQLDYGQDDIASSPPEISSSTSKVPEINMEDGQLREEGEISDSEGPGQTASGNVRSKSSPLPRSKNAPSPPEGSIRKQSPIPKDDVPAPAQSLLDRLSDIPLSASKSDGQSQAHESIDAQYQPYFVDADHVRPGLEMNQEQYDTAKDLVLDVLGWGVPPEYLLDCGLSREIVFYVFSELNLRLPLNLNTEGIIPYTPETLKALLRNPNYVSSPLGSDSSRHSGRPSLPHKSSPGRRLSRNSLPQHPEGALHDMERQRRQELLARKAVQASRKNRNTASMSPPRSVTAGDDVEMSAAPTESVDDFLKTIEPAKMDVDDTSGLPDRPPQQEPVPVMFDHMVESPVTQISFTEGQTSVASTSRRSPSSDETSGTSAQRRNSKRPVAADFVDFDSNAPRNRNGSSLSRKTGSFASISTMRRCVIDLSDSEGELDGEDVRMADPVPSGVPSSRYSTPPISSLPPSVRTKSPADLAAKELEIQKMRQMIAEREQGRVNKLKKLEAMSNNSDSVTVKQEEEDAASLNTKDLQKEPSPSATNNAPSETTIGTDDTSNTLVSTDSPSETQDTPLETQNDQVIPENAQVDGTRAVDVDQASSSSAQMTLDLSQHHPKPEEKAPQPEKHEQDAAYISLFDSYPLLRSRPRPILARELNRSTIPINQTSSFSNINHTTAISSSSAQTNTSFSSSLSNFLSSSALPDLRPLRLSIASQFLDSSKRICQYEIPGGGTCRDAGCEDIHISRLGGDVSAGALVEPSDQDTANYLSTAVPDSWTSAYGSSLTSRIMAALEEIRLNHPTMTLEERVAGVCEMLEPHPTT